jgi:chorismate synthase
MRRRLHHAPCGALGARAYALAGVGREVVLRAGSAAIAEAMLALVLMDHALRHRVQCSDVAVPTKAVE